MKVLIKVIFSRLSVIGWWKAARLFLKGFAIAAILLWLLSAQAAYAASDFSVEQLSDRDSFAARVAQQSSIDQSDIDQSDIDQSDIDQSDIDQWQAAIARNPSNDVAWNNLGQTLFAAQEYSGALMAYDHALMLSPDYSLALANRCGVLSQLEDYDQALISCGLALQGDGRWGAQGSALAWNNRGNALFNLKRYKASLRAFEKAILANPGMNDTWHNRSIVLSQLQQQP